MHGEVMNYEKSKELTNIVVKILVTCNKRKGVVVNKEHTRYLHCFIRTNFMRLHKAPGLKGPFSQFIA